MKFESKLNCTREELWNWIVSVHGISAELSPLLRMTAPPGIQKLDDVNYKSGSKLFRSYIFLLSVIPIDYSDMTLVELQDTKGFVENSPMGSMKSWRHERRIVEIAGESSHLLLVDKLEFEPRAMPKLVAWFIGAVFKHRHQVLRKKFI